MSEFSGGFTRLHIVLVLHAVGDVPYSRDMRFSRRSKLLHSQS